MLLALVGCDRYTDGGAGTDDSTMTSAEIAAVVASARKAEAVIEADNDAWRANAGEDRKVWLPAGIARMKHAVPAAQEAFDADGAERLLRERPNHWHATRVKRAKWRVETWPDSLEVLEVIWNFEATETAISAQKATSSTWAIELDDLCRQTLEGLSAVRERYEAHAAIEIDTKWREMTRDRLKLVDGLIEKVTERQAAAANEAAAQRATLAR